MTMPRPRQTGRTRPPRALPGSGPARVPPRSDHPYLVAKQAAPLALRMDASRRLVVPLQDIDGRIHSLETIAPDGAKRYLAGGAKKGHFAVVGAEPAPLAEPAGPVLICEGWATGASLHIATGHTVIAAMDAGNLMPVAEALRARFPEADLVLVADNDAKPDRDTNPGVEAARKVALAVDGRLAVPDSPGDANDLFCAEGPDAVAALVAGAARIPPPPPTYPAPVLTPDEARASLAEAIAGFMAAIPDYWAAVEAAQEEAKSTDANRDPLDFNIVARAALPPLLGLPVDVGLGKTSSARAAIAELIAAGGLGHTQGRLCRPAPRSRGRAGRGLRGARPQRHALEGSHRARSHRRQPRPAHVPRHGGHLRRARDRASGRTELLQGQERWRNCFSAPGSTTAATSARSRWRRRRRSSSAPMTASST